MTADQLKDLEGHPMPWEVWILRVLVMQPERICTAKEKAAWMEKRGEAPLRRFATKRDFYGIAGSGK